MFFYLCKVLFSGFLQFNGNFIDGQNSSKYRDRAPLNYRRIRVFTTQVLNFALTKGFVGCIETRPVVFLVRRKPHPHFLHERNKRKQALATTKYCHIIGIVSAILAYCDAVVSTTPRSGIPMVFNA